MHQVDIHKAISRLLKLMAETESGGETAVIGAGELSAKPPSYDQRSQPCRPGRLRNSLWVAEDFDKTPLEVVEAFESGE